MDLQSATSEPLNQSHGHPLGTPRYPLGALGYPLSTPGYPVLYLLSYLVVHSVLQRVPYLTEYLGSYLAAPMPYPALYGGASDAVRTPCRHRAKGWPNREGKLLLWARPTRPRVWTVLNVQ